MGVNLLAGALGGLLTVIILTFVLPRRWGHLRAIVAALGGFLMFYLLKTYVK